MKVKRTRWSSRARFVWSFSLRGNEENGIKFSDGNVLHVKTFKEGNEGFYHCYRLQDNKRKLVRKIHAQIKQTMPVIEENKREMIEAPFYQSAVAKCTVSGYPKPNITWILPTGGRPFGRRNIGKMVRTNNNGMLFLEKVWLETAGIYTCEASNGNGIVSRHIDIQPRPAGPRILKTFKKVTKVKRGRPVRLRCNIIGNPKPTVQWRKKKNRGEKRCRSSHWEFNSTDEIKISRINFRLNGDLVINRVRPCDRGTYYCSARNSFGKTEVAGRLLVQ